MRAKNGFTLIESLIVVAILAMIVSSFSLLKYIPSAKTSAFFNELRQDIMDSKAQAKIQKIPRIMYFFDNRYMIFRDENYLGDFDAGDTILLEKNYEKGIVLDTALTTIPKDSQFYLFFNPSGTISDNSSNPMNKDIAFKLDGKKLDSKINIGVGGYVKVK